MMRVLVIVLLIVAAALPVDAQAVASAVQGAPDRISISFDKTPLPDAIWTIARRAGVHVTFNRSKLPDKPVSYKGEGITPDAAFAAVLNGTGFRVNKAANGTFELVKDGSGKGISSEEVISGRVTDSKTGKGVSGANVSIANGSRSVITGEDGTYRLMGVASGIHVVTVRLVGYAKQTRSVTVGEGATAIADFKLDPSASVLDQVVVTGTVIASELKSVPNAITVVTAKQIEERGITRIDELFRGEVPGLFSLNLGTNAVLDQVTMFSRGATALTDESAGTDRGTNPIKTYIDGVEMANPEYLSQIDPKSIERIEILTGPQASTIYGSNAINGVMQIFTKRGSSRRPNLSLSVSSGVTQNNFSNNLAPSHLANVALDGIEGRMSYRMDGSWKYIGSWTPSKQTQTGYYSGSGRMEWARLSIDASARQSLTRNKQNGDANQAVSNLSTIGLFLPSRDIGLPLGNKTQTASGRTLGFSLAYRPYSWWSHNIGFGTDELMTAAFQTTPSYSWTSPSSDAPLRITPSTTSRTSNQYTTTMQLPISSFSNLNLVLGGDHWRTKGWRYDVFPLSSLNSTIPSACQFGGSCSRTHPGKNSGAFVQGTFAVVDALFLTYGVRADWNPNFGDKVKVKPGRYGVSYTHDFGLVSTKLRGSYGRSIRPPADNQKEGESGVPGRIALFGPYNEILPNDELGPEHQQGGEGGIELFFGSRGSLIVTRFNQTVDNLIAQIDEIDSVRSLLPMGSPSSSCSSSFRDDDGHCYRYQQQYLNVGSIRNQGWELQSTLNVGPLTTRGTYSWVKSRVLGITPRYKALLTGSQFEPGLPFDLLPEHTWAIVTTYSQSRSSVTLSINGISQRYVVDNQLDLVTAVGVRWLSNRVRMSLPSVYRPTGAGYATADLNASHRFSSSIGATFQVTNLTNYYQNDVSTNFVSIGRQSRIGLSIKFR